MIGLEKAARALCALEGVEPDEIVSFDAMAGEQGLAHKRGPAWELFIPIARAVLMAVREPDGMTRAAGRRAYDISLWDGGRRQGDTFTAMIDAILNETQP